MRRLRTWRSTMLLSATKSVPQMASRISSRVTTLSGATGEQVQQALLDAGQVDDRLAGAHLAVDDVDLHLAELDRRDDRPVGPRRATGDDDGPREQLLRREGHRQDVVDPEVERPKLRLEVAPSGQAQGRRDPLRQAVRRRRAAGAARCCRRGPCRSRPGAGCHSARIASASSRLPAARTTNRPWFRVSSMRSTTRGGHGAPERRRASGDRSSSWPVVTARILDAAGRLVPTIRGRLDACPSGPALTCDATACSRQPVIEQRSYGVRPV